MIESISSQRIFVENRENEKRIARNVRVCLRNKFFFSNKISKFFRDDATVLANSHKNYKH